MGFSTVILYALTINLQKNEPKCQNVSKIMVHAVFFFCIYLNNDGKNTKYTYSETTSTILPESLDIIVACDLFL